jgi:hypothetical protein
MLLCQYITKNFTLLPFIRNEAPRPQGGASKTILTVGDSFHAHDDIQYISESLQW